MTGHFSFNSIRARLTLSFSAAAAVLLLLAGVGAACYIRYDAEHDADALLNAAAKTAQRKIDPDDMDTQLIELQADAPNLENSSVGMLLVNPQGQVLRKTKNPCPPWPHTDKDGWRISTLAIGKNTVVAGIPWQRTERALKRQTLILAALCFVIFLAVTGGVWLLVGQALTPIRQLAAQAQAQAADSLRVQLAPSSQDAEIVQLVATLNGLLSRLSDSAAARGRFYAAASHELRTPLQALSGHLELALTRPRSAEAYREVVEEAQAQTRRLMALVQDLLLLNQLDSAAPPASEPVDPGVICQRAVNQTAALISARHLNLVSQWDNAAEIFAPPNHLEMLTRNLIENAVKYAKEGGTVQISFAENGGRLEVFNETEPIADWNSERLFEPFYRLDASRNAKTGGNGLGLAICKAIADANDWKITIEKVTGGVRAAVVFSEGGAGIGQDSLKSGSGYALTSAS